MLTSSQNQIDQIIYNIFGEGKIFFEAGGSNPFDQSNTTFLEERNWSGLVVEPKETWNNTYKNHRPKTILENFVLVSLDYKNDYIEGDFREYMIGGVNNIHKLSDWQISKHPCSTIDKLLNKHKINEIHFFSLDVEGYETEVLQGINFDNVFIHCMVIERHKINGVFTNFDFIEKYDFKKVFEIKNHLFYFNNKSEFKFNAYYEKECFSNRWKWTSR